MAIEAMLRALTEQHLDVDAWRHADVDGLLLALMRDQAALPTITPDELVALQNMAAMHRRLSQDVLRLKDTVQSQTTGLRTTFDEISQLEAENQEIRRHLCLETPPRRTENQSTPKVYGGFPDKQPHQMPMPMLRQEDPNTYSCYTHEQHQMQKPTLYQHLPTFYGGFKDEQAQQMQMPVLQQQVPNAYRSFNDQAQLDTPIAPALILHNHVPPPAARCPSATPSTASTPSSQDVPSYMSTQDGSAPPDQPLPQGTTSVLVRNIPSRCSQDDLIAAWPPGTYDLLHMPFSSKQRRYAGYCFLNFGTWEQAEAFRRAWHGRLLEGRGKCKVLSVRAAHAQGVAANIRGLKRTYSPSVSAKYLPAVFSLATGERLDFRQVLQQVLGPGTGGGE